jgi:hypothetical protein
MTARLLILEGLDGTGKTTIASKLIQMSTYTFPVHYIYFPKKDSEQLTYDYFNDLINAFKYLDGIIVLDRSIISTYAYGITSFNLGLLDLVRDYDPIIVYFEKVYDKSKLPIDYERVKKRYEEALQAIRTWLRYTVIVTEAQTFLTSVNSLEKLQDLFINRRLVV